MFEIAGHQIGRHGSWSIQGTFKEEVVIRVGVRLDGVRRFGPGRGGHLTLTLKRQADYFRLLERAAGRLN
jgi:hypothetical protein